MKTKNKIKPADLLEIFKLMQKVGIRRFEDNIPSILLEIIYGFIWEVVYKAKLLSKHSKRPIIDLIDIEIACKLESKNVEIKNFSLINLNVSGAIANYITFPGEKKIDFSIDLPLGNHQLLEENYKFKKTL
jgi:histone H3/H4